MEEHAKRVMTWVGLCGQDQVGEDSGILLDLLQISSFLGKILTRA